LIFQIVFMVDDRDQIIVKMCCICVCDFCVLKTGQKLEIRNSESGKELFSTARERTVTNRSILFLVAFLAVENKPM
jgi:hypothetical protein